MIDRAAHPLIGFESSTGGGGWRKISLLSLCAWGAFIAWFVTYRWDGLIGGAESALAIAVAAPLAFASSAASVGILHFLRLRSTFVRLLGAVFAALSGAILWYFLRILACKLAVLLALRFGFADRANNVILFFYANDGHFGVFLVTAFVFSVVPWRMSAPGR